MGFLMSFGVVIEGMTIAAFLILLAGGKQKREQGWPFMAMLTGVAALVQAIAMSLIVGIMTTLMSRILTINRPISSRTTIDSTVVTGFWTEAGSFALYLGSCK